MEHIMTKHCKACGNEFQPHPKTPTQTYCSSEKCQRERRRRWQHEKRKVDSDYRDNDTRQTKDWGNAHPDYWKHYRQVNPAYADRNRNLQQTRNKKLRESVIANGDDLNPALCLPSGRYRLTQISPEGIASEDAWIVEITVISVP
jgi:endogenous inhibitor of DNA gyrase (YacG/DUF329 family)